MTPDTTINVSVSNHYRAPSYTSEIITQGILGERAELLEQGQSFSKILQADGYESWISNEQVVVGDQPEGDELIVKSHFLRIYPDPKTTADGVKDAVIGCTLRLIDERGDWYRISLPDGSTGWAEKRHFGSYSSYSVEDIITQARDFLGYQYSWGGCTPKGFDCSGLVQTVFRLCDCQLPRDAWQQQKLNLLSTDYRDAQPADLLFFGDSPEKVTHVAISLGHEHFIHARGWVRLNSFDSAEADFSVDLLNTFISVNRYSA